jgi:glycosyltransferase involved in cell wall biosynthesis
MPQNHRVTIGLPVRNGGEFFAEALDSLLGQTYADFELLISDNASTDGTADLCRRYAKQDPRIRYIRQPANIGLIGNTNFVMRNGTAEFFKLAAHDDLYGRDLLKRCIEALDAHPELVAAHCWEARIDAGGAVIEAMSYPVAVDRPRAPDRFRSMLFDGWDDYTYAVTRTKVIGAMHPHGSYHLADRTFSAELSLYGPFYQVPEWLYFRREHEYHGKLPTIRARCARLDSRRANRFRHPLVRLYGEYAWSYIAAIRQAPLSAADKRECYGILARWLTGRMGPVAARTARGETMAVSDGMSLLDQVPDIELDALVAGRGRSNR